MSQILFETSNPATGPETCPQLSLFLQVWCAGFVWICQFFLIFFALVDLDVLSFLNCFFSGFVALGPEEVFLDFPCILATVIPNTQKGQKHFFRFFDTTSFFDQVLPS